MNKTTREEIGVIAIFFLISALLGSAVGYAGRAVSTKDKYLIATADRYFAERDYYNAQYQQIIKEGKNPIKENSK